MFITSNRLLLVPVLILLILSAPLAAVNAGPAAPATPSPATPSPATPPPLLQRAWDAPHVSDELLVKVQDSGRARLERSGVSILGDIPQLGLVVVRVKTGARLAEAAADLEDIAGIEWVEPNYTLQLDFVPNDPHYDTVAPTQTPYLNRIDAAGAWDLTMGRPEIVIAILDTGVEMSHEDLAGAIWTNLGEIPGNEIDDEGNGFIDDEHGWDFAGQDNLPDDDYGHGTHVAGIAAARIDNGLGIAGLAGAATIMPVDVFDYAIGTYEDLIRAIVYATDNGAHVINMSLGASSYSLGEEMAVNYAFSRGVVVVAAAGNTGNEMVHYPAAHPNAIAVASTTAQDVLSSFSTRGTWVDVAAPGSSIYSTVYGNGYRTMSGTSMATPHVAGLAALILSRNPTLTPTQVRDLIERTADDLGAAGRDIFYGAGRINAGSAVAATASPGLDIDLPGCRELVINGSFEEGLYGWQTEGAVEVDTTVFHSGAASLYFPGGASSRGVVTQTVTIPAVEGVVKFAYRIDPDDSGRGTTYWPFDDWFTVEWRTTDGQMVNTLLRTGNTADTVNSGLDWDRYLYRIEAVDMRALREHGPVAMVITAQNDADDWKTDFWLDSVQFCVSGTWIWLPQFWPG